jgi:predicted dehydrogenase/sugar phosphate isomerase/epimerase
MNKISIINDEVSDDIKEVVRFLKEHDLNYVELRSVNKKNIVNIPLSELKECASYLKINNINVSCLSSPLLKWHPKNVNNAISKDLSVDKFGFDEQGKDIYETIFQIADIFNSEYIRIFSYLKYEHFKLNHLKLELDKLIYLAEKYDKVLLIENEPVCNIDTIDELSAFIATCKSERIQILFDPGNLYKQGNSINYDKLLGIRDNIKYIHMKDYSLLQKKYTVLGHGDINYKKIVSFFSDSANKESDLFFSIETHVGDEDKYSSSSISVNNLKEILETKRVKYGIIGCGRIFKKHALSIKDDKNSELVGIFDIDMKKAKEKASEMGCNCYNSMIDLINDVDVVNICTPHNTHIKIIEEVLKGGKKCLCEKPGCIDIFDIDKISKYVRYKENAFVVCQNRFNKPVLELKKFVEENKAGKLLYVFGSVRWFRDREYYINSWQGRKNKEGGMLFNQGTHLVDIMMQYFEPNKKTEILSAFREKIYHKSIDTEDIFLAQFRSGKTIFNLEVMVSAAPCNLDSSLLFIFEKGRAIIGGNSFNGFLNIHLFDNDNKEFIYDTEISDSVYGYGHKSLIKKLSEYALGGKRDDDLVDFEEACTRVKFISELYSASEK